MADELVSLRDRLSALEHKTDAIEARIDFEVLEVSVGFKKQQEFVLDLFHQTEARFTQLEHRMNARFTLLDEKMDGGFKRVDKRLTRLESKFDRFIEAQTKFNRLAEARLRRLEATDRS